MQNEIWLPVVGHEGYYEVSNSQKIRSISRLTKFGERSKMVIGRELVIKRRIGKYPFVILSKENIQKSCMAHTIVADAFIPNPENLPVINHLDGNKDNFLPSNLERTTYKGNSEHAVRTGLYVNKSSEWAKTEQAQKFLTEKNTGDKNPYAIVLSAEQKNFVIGLRVQGASYRSILALYNNRYPDAILKWWQVFERICRENKIPDPKAPIQTRHLHKLNICAL